MDTVFFALDGHDDDFEGFVAEKSAETGCEAGVCVDGGDYDAHVAGVVLSLAGRWQREGAVFLFVARGDSAVDEVPDSGKDLACRS